MRNSEPQSVNHLFKATSLISIQEKGMTLSTINNLIYRFLPYTLRQHCRVANYRQGILIIEVASASWLTRLRYEQGKLTLSLRQNGLSGLSSIQYKVNPELSQQHYILQSDTITLPSRQITPQSASLLRHLAENAPPKLKTSLIKLANHVTKIDNSQG